MSGESDTMSTKNAPASLPGWFTSDTIHTVVLAFPDVYGRLMGKRLTYKHFVDVVLRSGSHACNYLLTVDIEMNPVDGFELASWDKGYGDFHIEVDLTTLRQKPWLPHTAIVLGDLYHEGHQPVVEAPRSVLKKQLERLTSKELSAVMASELEFYMFNHPYAEAHELGHRDLEPSSDYLIDYHLLQTARDEDVFGRLRNEMDQAGITVEGTKGEWGKGQHELNLLYTEALQMADRHVVFKHGAKQIADQEGRSLTFMAKWRSEDAGSSCHIHTSLWNPTGEKPSFIDDAGEASETFRHFIGGLMQHSRELSYFFAPTINSYKRYQAASWAPTSLVWANDNRTTGFRVVGSGRSLRVENRMPGADVNPYLAYAATIAAGLKGIEDKIDCGEAYVGNAYEDESLERLPDSLATAAELLDKSEFARTTFGDKVIDFYVRTAKVEADAHQRNVSDWERSRYFERI